MKFGLFRRKNTDLPLFNGSRNGSNASRKFPSKKHILFGLIAFVVLVLLFRPTPSSSETRRTAPKTRFDKYFNAREDLFNNRLFAIKSVASVCTNLDKNSTYWGQAAARYLPLGMDENSQIGHKYYFALTLRNAAIHLPTIVDNLLRVIYHLGEQNIFMSVYEGGSTDDGHTTAMLEVIQTTLEAIGIEHEILIRPEVGDPRNDVLLPLKRMYRKGGRVFQTVIMMGDDLWCAEELLELLFHSRGQAASITCSNDVRNTDDVFSISPGHDINGKLFREGKIGTYIQDEYTSSRYRNNFPFRVQSCFTSVTVLDPTPFYPPYDFSFLSHETQTDELPPPWETKCGFSSELNLALRYVAVGFNRAMLIPRAQTASTLLEFFKLHRAESELLQREQLHKSLGVWVEEDTGGRENPFGKDYHYKENEIVWQISPRVADKFECPSGNGDEMINLSLPQKFENGVVIHRELPVLPGD